MRCERGPAWRFPRSGRFQAREETAMTTTVASATTKPARVDEPRPADVFVAFGITGDLAKVMTFMSLYRLERRGPAARPRVAAGAGARAPGPVEGGARDSRPGA